MKSIFYFPVSNFIELNVNGMQCNEWKCRYRLWVWIKLCTLTIDTQSDIAHSVYVRFLYEYIYFGVIWQLSDSFVRNDNSISFHFPFGFNTYAKRTHTHDRTSVCLLCVCDSVYIQKYEKFRKNCWKIIIINIAATFIAHIHILNCSLLRIEPRVHVINTSCNKHGIETIPV